MQLVDALLSWSSSSDLVENEPNKKALSSQLNLRRSTRMSAWNVREFYMITVPVRWTVQLPQLSAELRVSVAALSVVRRSGSGRISGSGYTYYWFGRLQEHLGRLAVAVAVPLVPIVTEMKSVET